MICSIRGIKPEDLTILREKLLNEVYLWNILSVYSFSKNEYFIALLYLLEKLLWLFVFSIISYNFVNFYGKPSSCQNFVHSNNVKLVLFSHIGD